MAAQSTVFLEDLTWPEAKARQDAGVRRILIPTGGTEQNGPHIAIGKHNWIIRDSAARLAARLGDTLVAPVLAYVPEGRIMPPEGHMQFPGTISVRDDHYAAVLEDAARSLRQGGFTRIYFMGDSGGNQIAQEKVASRLTREWRRQGIIVASLSDYYVRGDAPELAHGAVNDAAQILAVHPAAVRTDKFRAFTPQDYSSVGAAGSPIGATAKKGRALLDARIAAAASQVRHLESAP